MGDLLDSVKRAVADVEPRDAATATLALTYAAQIEDGSEDLSKLGPPLLAALEALQLSPRARKAVKLDDKPRVSPLDQLAAARARKSPGPDSHATTA